MALFSLEQNPLMVWYVPLAVGEISCPLWGTLPGRPVVLGRVKLGVVRAQSLSLQEQARVSCA